MRNRVTFSQFIAWWPALVAGLSGLGLGGMLKAWLDHRRGMRVDATSAEMALIEQQRGLIEKLETRIDKLEASQTHERRVHEAEMKVLRHRLNNMAMSFNGLLGMIEVAPERAADIVRMVKAQRAEQEKAEAHEKAQVTAAILASSPAQPPEREP